MALDRSATHEIDGKGKTVRELLAGRKYSIDYYQREYKWHTKQVTELMDDLAAKFLESYDPGHERTDVASYSHYFLGSIIISDKDGVKFIIDGQQRLTTLSLMLIFLQRQLGDAEQRTQIADLIFSQKFSKRSFNLDIPERTACMEALYTGRELVAQELPESLANIMARYADIDEFFPDDLRGQALPYFVDWLIESVHLVEITAYSDSDAYTIFETMNDRGLSLTPADMLKGYLLAHISDEGDRVQAGKVWKERIADLVEIGKDEDADGIKSWLRSQYADTIRDRKRGAVPQDFDLIGTEFHRWVRANEERLGLAKSSDFVRFIDQDFAFYGHWYERLRTAADRLTPGLECVYFNAEHNFTLQYPVLLSPLQVRDDEETIYRKLRVTAAFLDILIHRRIWNWHAIDYSTMQYAMFLVMREIRGLPTQELAHLLRQRLDAETETFLTNGSFRLHGMNGRQIHRLLARMTEFVETRSGMPSHYVDYAKRGGKGATRSSTSGPTTPSDTRTSSPTPASSPTIGTGSATCCSCRRASTPASAICPTKRNCLTTTARICWPEAWVRTPTTTIQVSGAFWRRVACSSGPTRCSARPTWMSGRNCTVSWRTTSGARHGLMRRPHRVRRQWDYVRRRNRDRRW
jgi:uncharacterized protein DUF262